MDLDIRSGLSNFKITEKLKDIYKVPEDLIPNNDQITNRRFYLKTVITDELKNNTKGSFAKWREENNVAFETALPHDFLILDHILTEDDFVLIVSTPSLLLNAIKQDKKTQNSFIALD